MLKMNLRCLINPLNAELNPICHLLALLGGATIVVVSRLRVKMAKTIKSAAQCQILEEWNPWIYFGIRCPIISYFILLTVNVLSFHRPYHFMMASKVKGWPYSSLWGLAFICGYSCSLLLTFINGCRWLCNVIACLYPLDSRLSGFHCHTKKAVAESLVLSFAGN